MRYLATFAALWSASLLRADPNDPSPPGVGEVKTLPGFKAEVVYRLPRGQGSWVCMTCDPEGRLVASDQSGGLYRLTLPTPGRPVRVERLGTDLGSAQGLAFAFGSLYAVVNKKDGSGLCRARDTDGDDKFDEVTLLRRFDGDGEHGPHAVVPGPDGKSLYVVGGNGTRLPPVGRSLVPRNWAADELLSPVGQTDGAFTREMPGGWVVRTDPGGKAFDLVAIDLRNAYDLAFGRDGELFTYDSDMEWDMGTPWYRPTRVCHLTSGAEFGWRTGTNKWPDYYPDGLPAVVDIGAGSPTGVCFGYGAKFPARYQRALFVGDWSYGRVYAVRGGRPRAARRSSPRASQRVMAGSPGSRPLPTALFYRNLGARLRAGGPPGPRGRGDEWHLQVRKPRGGERIGRRCPPGGEGAQPPHRHGAHPMRYPESFRRQAALLRRQFLQDGGLPFTDVLTDQVLADALAAVGGWLDRVFSPFVTLWVFLGQVLSADHSCRAAVARLNAHRAARGQRPCSARTGAYCRARRRLPEAFFSAAACSVGRDLDAKARKGWLWKGGGCTCSTAPR